MGDNSKIEWTDASWNPIRARYTAPLGTPAASGKPRIGWHCAHVSEGCRNCYAETMNRRLGTGLDYKPGHEKDVQIFLDEKMLLAPLRWKRPRKIFVGSMTDLFADFVKDEWLDRIFAVMALYPQHVFQVLTKRPERMRAYCAEHIGGRIWRAADTIACALELAENHPSNSYLYRGAFAAPWPLPNVWLGTSCEDQLTADERIPHLLSTPAAVRFLSCEPLLGPINLRPIRCKDFVDNIDRPASLYALDGKYQIPDCHYSVQFARVDWLICGGESGPNARPMHPDWARALRDQCAGAGVPFFMKQMTKKAPIPEDLFVRKFPNGH